jgi:hypothetical protein
MKTAACKPAADSGIFQRSLQEGTLHVFSFFVIVSGIATSAVGVVIKSPDFLILASETSCQHPPRANGFSLAYLLFVYGSKFVFFLQGKEVETPAKNVFKRQGKVCPVVEAAECFP